MKRLHAKLLIVLIFVAIIGLITKELYQNQKKVCHSKSEKSMIIGMLHNDSCFNRNKHLLNKFREGQKDKKLSLKVFRFFDEACSMCIENQMRTIQNDYSIGEKSNILWVVASMNYSEYRYFERKYNLDGISIFFEMGKRFTFLDSNRKSYCLILNNDLKILDFDYIK